MENKDGVQKNVSGTHSLVMSISIVVFILLTFIYVSNYFKKDIVLDRFIKLFYFL